jgi:Leucine-rich repeat (LRR) protein
LDAQLFLKLRSLKILDLSQNRLLSSLPHELFQSTYHLKGEKRFIATELLVLFRLFARFICFKLIYLFTHANSCRIDFEVINLARNKLRDLPNLQEQVELEELDISKNEIRVVGSNSFKQLKNLKTLRLSENFIGKLSLHEPVSKANQFKLHFVIALNRQNLI